MSASIDEETIRHVARLARIEVEEREIHTLASQFAAILAYFDKLNELDTNGIEPLASALETRSVMAEDTPGTCLATEEALAAAPERDGPFFKVPKVLGDS